MKEFLENCWSGFVADDDKLIAYPLPAKLGEAGYDKGVLIPDVQNKIAKGWKTD